MLFTNHGLLGETLKQAGLISDLQIKTVLEDRKYSNHLRVGEIMALRGWIDQKTADFFAEEWYDLVNQAEKQPLGYYLVKSGLLTDQQIDSILQEQQKIWVKFGSVAILQGILTQETLDFFVGHLYPLELLDSPLIGKKIEPKKSILVVDDHHTSKNFSEPEPQVKDVDDDDIPWID